VEVLSPGTDEHDHVRKGRACAGAGVREYWLVHPGNRIVTIYRLEQRQFGKPDLFYLTGETPVGILPGVAITWDALVQRLPEPDI